MAERAMDVITVATVLFCATAGECALTLHLNGDDSIPTDGSGRVLITDIGTSGSTALICDSDNTTTSRTADWYINAVSQSTASEDKILSRDSRGWRRSRDSLNGIVRLFRNDETIIRFEGVFTCQIEEDPESPISVGIYYEISSVDVTIDVVSARDGTYTVTCTTTGGTVLSGSLTGPAGLNIHLQPVGNISRTGQDSYSATTGSRTGGSDGDTYQCTASNGVSSPVASDIDILRVANAPIVQSANQVPPGNAIRVTWSQPVGGAPVTGYRVYYSGGDDVGYVVRESIYTMVDITSLVIDGHIYTISVEALSLHLSGESSTMDVVLAPLPNAPSGIVVSDVKPHSVQVSWMPEPNTTRYIVDYEQVMGTDQLGLCSDVHSGSVTTADYNTNVTVEGIDHSGDFRLRAFTTYSITVRAVREGVGNSGPSEARIFTTTQTAADSPPAVIEAIPQSSTSILVQWDPIPHCPDINGNITYYSINYRALSDGTKEMEMVPGTWNVGGQVTLSDLTPFTEYSIQVAAVNSQSDVGVYSDPVMRQTLEDTPGPVVISLSKTTFQTTISWSPPETPNGIIIAYEVSYLQTANPQNVTCINTTDQATNLSLHELQPETQYTFTVRAYTQAGAGEESIVMYTTSDRPGVLFQLHLEGVFGCQEWVKSHVVEKLTDISSALHLVVQESCQCRYGQANIDQEVFHCFEGSENSVTYRVRLLATADVSIQSLTSYLEEWVAGGKSIVVGGVNLIVDNDCSVEIADLLQQEEGCREEATKCDITGVAVASSVGGAVLITSTIIAAVVIATVVILKRRCILCRRSSTIQQEVLRFLNLSHTDALRERMYHNAAYGQTREVEKEGSHEYARGSQVSQSQDPVYEAVYDN